MTPIKLSTTLRHISRNSITAVSCLYKPLQPPELGGCFTGFMITAQPPTIPTPQDTLPQIVQQLTPEQAPAAFQRNDLGDFVKKLVLGHFVQKSIEENTAQQIITGVQILDLQKNTAIVSHNADTQHFAASINKLPVTLTLLEALRAGTITMDQTVSWAVSDQRAGAGIYDQPGAPTQAKVKDILHDLLNRSGNTAVRIIVNQLLGGAAAVNNRWAQIPELANTRLQPLDSNRFYVGNSTPREAMWTMGQLVKTQDQYASFIKQSLQTNIYTDVSVRSQLAGNDYIVLVNKVGLLDDSEGNNRHDVGIIYNTQTKKSYGFSFFTTSPYDSETATPRAEQSLKDMGRYTLRFAGDKKRHAQVQQPMTLSTSQPPIETRILY